MALTVRATVLVAALSVLLSVGVRILGYNGFIRSPFDIYRYTEIRNIFFWGPFPEEHWPYLRFPFEYQPLIGWISGALSLTTGTPSDFSVFMLLWAIVLAAAAGGTAYLLGRHAAPWRVMVFWSASPQLLVLSGLNFDTIPTLLLVAAAVAVTAERRAVAAALLAAGAAAKLFPGAALPLLVLGTARASIARALLVGVVGFGVLTLIDGPAIVAPYSLLSHGNFGNAGGTNLWPVCNCNRDTVWTFFGIVAEWFVPPATAGLLATMVSTAGAALTYVWACALPAWRGEPLARLFYRSAIVILLWTRLFSPQYAIWVLPALTIMVPQPGLLAFLAVGDLVTFASIFAIGQGLVGPLGSEESVPAITAMLFGVLVRHAGLILLLRGTLSWRREAAPSEKPTRTSVIWSRVYAGVLAVAVIGGVALNAWTPPCTTTTPEWNDFIHRINAGDAVLGEAQKGLDLVTLHDVAAGYRRSIASRPVPCSVEAEAAALEAALLRLTQAETAPEVEAAFNAYFRASDDLARRTR